MVEKSLTGLRLHTLESVHAPPGQIGFRRLDNTRL